MIPYPRELLNSPNNYGIVKTQTVYGFGRVNRSDDIFENTLTTTEPFDWARSDGEYEGRYLNEEEFLESRTKKRKPRSKDTKSVAKERKSGKKHKKRKSHFLTKGVKKCFLKVMKQIKKRRKHKSIMSKKYMVPLFLGILAAKSILLPLALKAMALLSAKGVMMGFFATVLASMLGLKNLFTHSHSYQSRKDGSKAQVEIIQVPSNDDHYYHDNYHYRRDDYDHEIPYVLLANPGSMRLAPSENVRLEPYGNVRLAPTENRLAPRENEVPVKNRRKRQ